ncbi:hypothetical protein ABZ801_12620 [Actinomadura sp. NPDC047616]|uniref:hypothetical protein n=1 Tax=Actinomadura sp. NPDC047616 TaxID=3155914 RepID=UPI00340959BB
MANLSIAGILRSVIGTVVTLLVGVGLATLGIFFAVTQAPDGVRDLRAYEAAQRCPAAPSGPAECRWTKEFTVSGVRLTNKRGESDRVVLTDADGVRWETYYSSRVPLVDSLDEGDRVTGTIWRGRLTEIAADGESQRTHEAPANLRARFLILALITVPSGLLMAASCLWRLARRASDPTPGMVATLGLSFGLFFGGLFTPLLTAGSREENFWLTAAVWLPIAAIMTAVARVHVTQKRAAADADTATPAS